MDVTASNKSAAELNDLAVVKHREGKHREADDLYQRSTAIWEELLGPGDPLVAQSYSNRAALYREMGVFDEAERVFQIAMRIWSRQGYPSRFDTPLWADVFDKAFTLRNFGANTRRLRERVLQGDSAARGEVMEILRRLGPWYHNVELAPDVMTNPANKDYPMSRWRILDRVIPKDLKGKTVLDIGCNSGFFSLEMKKRGADRVVGSDIMLHVLAQSRFLSHWLELPLELHEQDAYDVQSLGMKFDVVLFIGVLYHLKHPLYALEKISSVCNEAMYFQSGVRGPLGDMEPADDYPGTEDRIFDRPEWPKMYFIEKKFNGDESNWWFATRSCLKAMLRTAGFRTIEDTANPEIFVCRK
jgi:tRNA (mo5U34)-methyltransferase